MQKLVLVVLFLSHVFAEDIKKPKPAPSPFSRLLNWTATSRYIGAFLLVLMAAYPLGFFFPRYCKLPLIIGYLIIGVMAGPYLTDLIVAENVAKLSKTMSSLALSFISCQAGQEIYLPELKPQLRGIMQLLLIRFAIVVIIMTGRFLVASSIFFYEEKESMCQFSIAFLFGSIAVLVSPATIMAIKIELNSSGISTNLMLGAVMLSEFIVLVAFSVARLMTSVYCAKLSVTFINIFFTGCVIASNMLVGAIAGGIIIAIFKLPSSNSKKEEHSHAIDSSLYLKGFLWLLFSHAFYVITGTLSELSIIQYGHSWDIKLEPILVLMIGSCIAGHHAHIRHDMHVILDAAAPYIFLPFFVLTGAGLKLDQVITVIPLTTFYVVIRYISNFIACYASGRFLLKLPRHQYMNLWLTMSPQAGVTLGLASEIQAMSSDPWTNEFATTLIAAVIVNQIIGPVLCSMGLRNSGECDSEEPNVEDGLQPKSEIGRFSESHYRPSHRISISAGKVGQEAHKVRHAIVAGKDEMACEVGLQLSLSGAQVTLPLLDEHEAQKWMKSNQTILASKYVPMEKRIQAVQTEGDHAIRGSFSGVTNQTDVIVFTGDPEQMMERVQFTKATLKTSTARLIAIVPDCVYTKRLRKMNILTIQPSIAIANIVTRIAILSGPQAQSFANELSTSNDFSTATYFMRKGASSDLNAEEMRFGTREIRQQVLRPQDVAYETISRFIHENARPHLAPSRFTMFGTSAVAPDPFAHRRRGESAYEYYVEDERNSLLPRPAPMIPGGHPYHELETRPSAKVEKPETSNGPPRTSFSSVSSYATFHVRL
uniref:Uncharacterized protein AlNc14C23G2338 n=1 Tax=Albugo laibachii Nc14 TaxID=890382 RepID=F0W636_9STRA|nr:conserved hypothetical protein [Albugo laibachii Nc14]|eukprot:CCA16578.1 conserved hypothetical protein [Albugo laibachii Nc14]